MRAALQYAIENHKAGRNEDALKQYESLIRDSWNDIPSIVPMNAAAILRQNGDHQTAISLLHRALTRFPEDAGLWNNLGNCFRDQQKLEQSINCYRQALRFNPSFTEARLSFISALLQSNLPNLAYAAALKGFNSALNAQEKFRFAQPLIESLLALSPDKSSNNVSISHLANYLESDLLKTVDLGNQINILFSLANVWIHISLLDKAMVTRDLLKKRVEEYVKDSSGVLKPAFQTTWHQLSWNLSICLLKQARFAEGWRLFEHGLQVPAAGPQRWQRALQKPFSCKVLPFWKGESLKGKRLLLLAEQGIGDGMMFATLIPKLQSEGATITLYMNDRIFSMYKRSLPGITVVSQKNSHNFSPNSFDLQSPLGSICQYRFHEFKDYAPQTPFLRADKESTEKLRNRYFDGRPLVGISWQGGGKPERIKDKSIGLSDLQPILSRKDVRFVSLQYGDDGPHLERFKQATGCHVLHDDDVNPLVDMDYWLAQVSSMDAVISIANTTIHGAGGLGIPTFCLVSCKSDWRWVNPDIYQGCYWYSSVNVSYQSSDLSWQHSVEAADHWLTSRI